MENIICLISDLFTTIFGPHDVPFSVYNVIILLGMSITIFRHLRKGTQEFKQVSFDLDRLFSQYVLIALTNCIDRLSGNLFGLRSGVLLYFIFTSAKEILILIPEIGGQMPSSVDKLIDVIKGFFSEYN